MELSRKLSEKIHIQEDGVYDQYTSISILSECVTNVKENAKIYLKPKYMSSTKEPENDDDTLRLQLSAMYWDDWKEGSPFMEKMSSKSYRVCYATHNSFSEIKDFLMFLQPNKVYLNVVPENARERTKMYAQLANIQRQYLKEEIEPSSGVKKFKLSRILSMKSRADSWSRLIEHEKSRW